MILSKLSIKTISYYSTKDENESYIKSKNYDVNYKCQGNETLKDIYEVDYFLIFPDMRPKQYWDLYLTLLVVVSTIITPWRLAFIEDDDTVLWIVIDSIIDLFFLIDIFINFFTVYTNHQEDYVINRKKIFLNYLFGWFIFDITAIIPINYFFSQEEGVSDLARLARLPRLYKLVKIFRIVKQSSKIRKYVADSLKISLVEERVLSFTFFIIIITHVLAWMWYFTARWDDFDPDTWVAKTGYLDESDFRKYMYCFYFAITVITTVGYGDMPIGTTFEKTLAIWIIVVGVITFSFAIGSLMSVLENIDNAEAKFKGKFFELNSIRNKYSVSNSLYNRIYKAIRYKITQNDQDINKFIETFPLNLKTELMLKINKEIISKIPYFKEKDENFWALAAECFRSSKRPIYKDEYIFSEDEPIYEIFFLLSGKAGYVVREDGVALVFWEIYPGNLFGELDFFSVDNEAPVGKRQFNVKALVDSEIISLSKEAIYQLEQVYPNYIEEIFEFANYRLRKLHKEMDEAKVALAKSKRKVKKEHERTKGKIILKQKTANLDEKIDESSKKIAESFEGNFREFFHI